MPVELWKAKARRYAALRWLGIALFCVAAPNLLAAIAAVATDRAGGGLVAISLFATGVSLGTFGSNDDSTLHAYSNLEIREALDSRMQAELDAERAKRPGRVEACHDHPKATVLLPVIATAVLLLAMWRVTHAWGVIS